MQNEHQTRYRQTQTITANAADTPPYTPCAKVIMGGIAAPPAIPVVINPDISFSESGISLSARENTTEYIDDIEYPTSPIPANAAISDSENIVNTSAKIASIMCILKYAKESIFESIAAPAKVPAVLHAKYTLGASPTRLTELSSDGSSPSFSMRTIGEAIFIPMSSPTTATIAKNNARIVLLESSPATFPMEADPRSGGSGISVK